MRVKTKILIVFSTVLLTLGNSSFAAGYSNVLEAYALDTVAGYSTMLRSSKTAPNSEIVFRIKKPNNEMVALPATTNANGIAITELSDYYTKSSGTYELSATLEGIYSSGQVNSFEVHPGNVSSSVSMVSPADQVVHSPGEKALITVNLFDDYKNSVEGHAVKLISSSPKDEIRLRSRSNVSDSNGEVIFEVASDQVGMVTYSVYDATADVVLGRRARMVYFNSSDYIFSNNDAQQVSFAAFGNSSGPVDRFEFKDLPESVAPGESVTLNVTAYDAADQVVIDYLGKIRFSAVGDNAAYANLPDDYTFVAMDQGSHTFSLAFLFQQSGSYKLDVTDLSDPLVFGVASVEVAGGAGSVPVGGITLSNPISGTYSNNTQVISGKASPGDNLKIFDNDIEITTLVANVSGNFSYTTGVLLDGEHKIYVASVNEVGTILDTSPTVDFIVDTAAPEISRVVLEPSGLADPGSSVTVKLYVEDELSQASMLLTGNIYELEKTPGGFYQTSFAAPIEFGEYKLDFILVDELGNESRLNGQATLRVGGLLLEEKAKPGNVGNLVVVTGDSKVTLNWAAATSVTNPIGNYRIFYGLSPNQLTEAIDTFSNATTWYIPALQNDVEYYFAVIAVDDNGNTSEQFSNIVVATPRPSVVEVVPLDVLVGAGGAEALEDMEKDVSDAGPEILWLVLLSAIGGIFYNLSAKKRLSSSK